MENQKNNIKSNKEISAVPSIESKSSNNSNDGSDCAWDFFGYHAQVIPFGESEYNKEPIDENLIQGITGFAVTSLDIESAYFIDRDVDLSNYFFTDQGLAIYCQFLYGKTRSDSISRFAPLYLLQLCNGFEIYFVEYLTTIIAEGVTKSEIVKQTQIFNTLGSQYKLFEIINRCMFLFSLFTLEMQTFFLYKS